MRALVLDENWKINLVDRTPVRPAAHEVLVEPIAVGICGTDLNAHHHRDHFRPPVTLGHEIVGRVVALGDACDPSLLGTLIAVNPNAYACGRCHYCLREESHRCRVATRERALGVHRDGGLADLMSVPSPCVVPVPTGLDPKVAVLAEPLATVVRAVARGQVHATGKNRLVIGAGLIGQLACQELASQGYTVFVVEPNDARREAARRFCHDTYPNLAAVAVLEEIDWVVECSGHAEVLPQLVKHLPSGATVVVVGVPDESVPLNILEVVMGELCILGSCIYSDQDFKTALERLRHRSVVSPDGVAFHNLEKYAQQITDGRLPRWSDEIKTVVMINDRC